MENGDSPIYELNFVNDLSEYEKYMDPADRDGFFRWLAEFEYGQIGLPTPDLVIWLDMPIERAVANLRSREAATHTSADIHEVDTAYLETCYTTAKQAAEFYGWKRISCVNAAGELRTPEEIHLEIISLLYGG